MARANATRNKRGASKGGSKRQVPGWVWLFTGVVTGLFIAFLVHLAQLRASHPQVAASHGKSDQDKETPAAGPDKKGKKPRFDFYAVLPKMEVILPKDEQPKDKGKTDKSTGSGKNTASADNSGDNGGSFMLQAGSFRHFKDADQRRAKLILQGYQARVQSVEMDSGESWHRVMVGPFKNMDTMHDAQDKLASAGIDTLPIRAKTQ